MSRINVRVIPNAKKNRVEAETGRLKVHLTAPPQDGKANELLRELLAEYYGIKRKQILLVRGAKSRDKIVEII
jgi:uncharacterized protein